MKHRDYVAVNARHQSIVASMDKFIQDVSIVVTGHSTRSIAVYATRLSQVRNDNIYLL
jgi:hypothetical protein